MADKICVRLVPKTSDGRSIAAEAFTLAPENAKANRPDRGRAREAERVARDLGMDARVTRHNSVDAVLSRKACEQLFGAKLQDSAEPALAAARGLSEGKASRVKFEERPRPTNELVIPEGLRDYVAFAYVPTPPEFFAETYIPPNVDNYHLRLQDVANALRAPSSHRNGWTGRGTRLAMTDTGFARHPYFDRQAYTIERFATPSQTNPEIDTSGHGTGESANALFMASDCVFLGIKHNDYSAEAMEAALDQNPDIITNSWGWNVDFLTWAQLQAQDPNLYNELRDLENIINDAIDDGVLIVFAAGNGHKAFPASMPNVLAVGGVSVKRDGSLEASSYASSFTSMLYPGRNVPDVCGVVGEFTNTPLLPGHIMLPVSDGAALDGENMPAATSSDGWGIFSGTSAASPQIAGVASLLLSANGRSHRLAPDEIRTVLQMTATDVTTGTTANGDTATVGPDAATGAGLVNAAEAAALVANGAIEANIASGVTDAWSAVNLADEHAPRVGLFVAMQTFHGSDPAAVRLRQPTQTGFRVKVEEEQSKDVEIAHLPEEIGYLAIKPGTLFDKDAQAIGEIQMLEIEQPSGDDWQLVNLEREYEDAVIIAQIMTLNGWQPAHTRIRHVNASSFEIQVEEWDYLNGMHPPETIACLAIEQGAHELPGGRALECGTIDTDHNWASAAFTGSFGSAPVVLSNAMTYHGNQEIVTRQKNVGTGGFDVRLQEEENRDGVHLVETVGWVAIQQ